jgi:ribosome recycling factor
MTLKELYTAFDSATEETNEWFAGEVRHLRTGRATPDMISSLPVEHYGTRTPLNGVASITLSDARTLVVSPWDATAIPAIEKALMGAQLGVQPTVDGKIIRLMFPMLTEERRQQTIKRLHQIAEEARVRLRRSRDEIVNKLKAAKQDHTLPEDDFFAGKEELDKRIGAANDTIESLVTKKTNELKEL